MQKNQLKQIAAILWALRSSGNVIHDGPTPANESEGRKAQLHYTELSGDTIAGWKIAATSFAGQNHIGVDGPLEGPYLSSHIYPTGATLSMTGNHMAVAEAEFAFCVGKNLVSRKNPYSVTEILDSMASLHPSLELPDSRYADFSKAGAAALLADCACNKDWVIGEATTQEWRSADLSQAPTKLHINNEVATQGSGVDALGGPINALKWVVNKITSRGITIEAGQYITTGVCGMPKPIRAGDYVVADLGIFGTASATLVE